jgi:hypothetical protein
MYLSVKKIAKETGVMKKRRKPTKYNSIEKKKAALELSEQEWHLLDKIRYNLIPGRPGIVAGVMRRRPDQLWQGWICVAKRFINISARSSWEQARADVEAFLTATDRPGFSGEDAKLLLSKFNAEGEAPPEALSEDLAQALLYYLRIIIELDLDL